MQRLPPGWIQYTSPQNGAPYYYNTATGVTTWHHPSASPPPPPPGPYPSSTGGGHPTAKYSAPPPGYPGHSKPVGYPGSSSSRPPSSSAATPSERHYIFNQAVEFKLKEKAFSLSGDGFSVKNTANGATVFKVKGSVMSLNDKKKIVDASSGRAIYTMIESILTLRGRMSIVDSSTKKPVVTLRKKGFIPMMGTSTVQIWKGGSDDGDPWLQCKGDYIRKNFDFKEKSSGRSVASVRRKSMNLSNILLEKDTYIVRVEPGFDAALAVFLVVALDEQYRDDGNRTGLESRLGGFF